LWQDIMQVSTVVVVGGNGLGSALGAPPRTRVVADRDSV
jgi:hypothetical protein